MLPGPYLVPAYRVAGHIRLTNKTPCGTYRAPGRYESTFVRERLIDEIAKRLGLDPVEVRRVNLIPREQMPLPRGLDALGTEVIYDSGDYPGPARQDARALDLLRSSGPSSPRGGRRASWSASAWAIFVEKSGLGPFDGVRITVDRPAASRW